ncbi:MAG: peptidoglycan DD-metalloendopeptidase family protein [Rhizonema sp. NSF051]|nr:peptidoglycan DD-metalloendopeptidase family protein [Rhizonema sp. NSF051]
MQENTPSDDAPVEQINALNPRINYRVPRKAAMIGLAISMGATSLLVTRQSDRAQAAEPTVAQNTNSIIPSAANNEVNFHPTKLLGTPNVASVSVPENPAIIEPTAISQVAGLGAKWQAAAKELSRHTSGPILIQSSYPITKTIASNPLPTVQTLYSINTNKVTGGQNLSLVSQQQTVDGFGTVNAQLKAQQEFALNNLQEKSNRLRKSLTQLRSGETKNLSSSATSLMQPINVAGKIPQANTVANVTESQPFTNTSKASLVSRLKQSKSQSQSSAQLAGQVPSTTPATTVGAVPSTSTVYEVKPGDTLAIIANNYGSSVPEIIKANNLNNPNQLHISQTLTIPAVENPSTAIPSAVSSSNTAKVPNTNANSVAANNTIVPVSVPTPASTPQIQVDSVATTLVKPETTPSTANYYGMGGDSPVPQAMAEMLQSKQVPTVNKVKQKQNPRLHSLQAEIDRLREKYRVQQSGNSSTTPVLTEVSQTSRETNDTSVQIPVSSPNYQPVPIAVPRPMSNYRAQPVRVQVQANEPINPELWPTDSRPDTRVATPQRSIDTTDSLGKWRGTTVSPSLPPLAAVDIYLPKPIDETTPTFAGYMWPAKGVLTSGFGMRWGRMHKGIDVANSTGTPVYAAADGVIEKAGWNNGGYGNVVDVRHPDGSMTRYGHNSKILVHAGQPVHQGETIALMGSTGFSTGPHCHFEVHPAGKDAVNPIAFLPRL